MFRTPERRISSSTGVRAGSAARSSTRSGFPARAARSKIEPANSATVWCFESAKMQAFSTRAPELSIRTWSPSTAARPSRSFGRRNRVRSFACSPWNRAVEMIDSLSIRSRLSDETTSWSVTSTARSTVKPRITKRSGGRSAVRDRGSASRARRPSRSTRGGTAPTGTASTKRESKSALKWRSVPGHHGEVLDGLVELGGLAQLLLDHPREHPLDGVGPRHLLRPEVGERRQAQLDLEREIRRQHGGA